MTPVQLNRLTGTWPGKCNQSNEVLDAWTDSPFMYAETAEPEVTILNLTILTPDRPDLVLPIPLVRDDKGYAFALKDGSTYSFRFSFTVSNNIVSGLRYTHTVWKAGVRGDS